MWDLVYKVETRQTCGDVSLYVEYICSQNMLLNAEEISQLTMYLRKHTDSVTKTVKHRIQLATTA